MTEIEHYDRSDWQLCLEEGCLSLFKDNCLGPAVCAKALKRASGIQIYVALEDGEPQYVTTQAKRH